MNQLDVPIIQSHLKKVALPPTIALIVVLILCSGMAAQARRASTAITPLPSEVNLLPLTPERVCDRVSEPGTEAPRADGYLPPEKAELGWAGRPASAGVFRLVLQRDFDITVPKSGFRAGFGRSRHLPKASGGLQVTSIARSHVVVLGSSSAVTNLLANHSVEPPAASWQCYGEPAPNNWGCHVWQGDATLLWISSTHDAFSGDHYVMINGHDDNTNAGWFTSPYFPIEDHKQYSFTGWVRADYMLHGARAYLSLKFFDGMNVYMDGDDSDAILSGTSGQWVQVKGSAMPPDGAEKARLDVKLGGIGNVRFDSVIVSDSPIVPFLKHNVLASPDPVAPTGTLTYVVAATNTGGSPAHSVCLTSTLDRRATLMAWSADQNSTYTETGKVNIWCFVDDVKEEGGSLSVTLVVAVHVITDAHIPLHSTFGVSADGVESTVYPSETLIGRDYKFELSRSGPGWAAPGVSINCAYTVTNSSNCPISFTTFAYEAVGDCGDATAYPEKTGSVPSSESVPLTMTFVSFANQQTLPRRCLPVLIVEAPNAAKKASTCEAFVIPDRLRLDIVGDPNPVQAGKELTYTLHYTYVGGINADGLRITVTLDGPAEISTSIPPPNATASGNTYVWLPVTRTLGGTGTITAFASITAGSTGLVTCTAQAATRDAEPVARVITIAIGAATSNYTMYLPMVISCVPPPIIGPLSPGDVVTYSGKHWYYVDLPGPGRLEVTVHGLSVDGNLLFYRHIYADCAGTIRWNPDDLLANFGGNDSGSIDPMVLTYVVSNTMRIYAFVYVPGARVPTYTIEASY